MNLSETDISLCTDCDSDNNMSLCGLEISLKSDDGNNNKSMIV